MGSAGTGDSGILSNVFNFVSREFESFIANATGSEPSTSRVLLNDSIDSDFSREASPVERETPSPRKSTRKAKQPQSDPSAENEREAKTSRRKRIKKVVASSEEDDLPSEYSRLSPKLQLSRSLKRRPSISMPGSLFPRSPSMDPDADPSAAEKEQRVRFAFHVSQTLDHQSPQRHKSSSSKPLDGSASTSRSPRCRPQFASSVKTAVDKFHIGQDDADPSILLPSPKRSPHAMVASRNLQSRRTNSPGSPSAPAMRHKRKNLSVESFSDDSGDTSGFLLVKGKEKELIAARKELYENGSRDNEAPALSVEQAEHDRNRDKVRIKMLEEEVERLKQELSKRPVPAQFGAEKGPPPPPPPPPPSILPKKILLSIPAAASESHLFASARASLKQAPPPVENPINPLIGRRAGKPTVGLAADKMAAFLSEMKTVRLRKVSGRSSGNNPAPASLPSERFSAQAALRRSSSSQRSQLAMPLLTSIRASNIDSSSALSEKRKRNTINIHDDANPPPKRRLRISSTDSSLATGSNSSSLLPEDTLSVSSLSRSYPPHSKATNAGRTWQSGSIAEAPTPSLCSDNDIEQDVSLDDQPPSTPPAPVGPSRNVYRFKGNGIPVGHDSSRQIHIGMDNTSHNTQGGRNFGHPRPNIFDKRLPSSPFPDKSPRRPRPPSRISRPAPQLALPSPQEDRSDEEDPLSLSFSSPDDSVPHVGQQQTTSRVKNIAEPSARSRDAQSPSLSSRNRRRTLDEELRDLPFNHCENFEDEAVFTGVGTRSKLHGFLAHGGAGGAPVFMGVGYVEGAEGDDVYVTEAEADDEYLPANSTRRGRNQRR
ncbi:hypothetical protein BYT27DRAFT_7235351 [Phlegmacium glaucopus]|nr:hypothetical protein BYT27DRAFT_7235351 [Phlegmacium glaucopus]